MDLLALTATAIGMRFRCPDLAALPLGKRDDVAGGADASPTMTNVSTDFSSQDHLTQPAVAPPPAQSANRRIP